MNPNHEKIVSDLDRKILIKDKIHDYSSIENIKQPIIIFDTLLKIITLNIRASELIGKPTQELYGKTFYSLLNKKSFFDGIKLFDKIKINCNYSGNFAIHIKKSEFLPLKCDFIRSENNFYYCFPEKVENFIPSPPDPAINLEETNNLYINKTFQALIDNSPAAISILDLNSNVLVWNKEAETVYGWKSKDVVGKLLPTLTEESYDEHLAIRDRLLSGDNIEDYDVERKRRDGSLLWLNLSISPVTDKDGKIFATMSIATDITLRKKAEEAVHQSEEQLKIAQQIGNIGILEMNLLSREVICSDEIYKICEEEFLGGVDDYLNFVHPEDRDIVHKAIKNSLEMSIPFKLDHRIMLRDGKIKYLHTRSRIFNDSSGVSTRLIIVVQDITERKKHEVELQSAMLKAEESNRLKTAFLQNMSHEIRTPMNGILGFTQLLLEPEISNDEMKFYVQTINNSCTNLLNIINDVVEISKIEAGVIQVYRTVFNLNQLFDELFNFFTYEASQKNIKLICNKELNDDLCLVFSDEQKIRQILTNLIKNSLKFTHQGQIVFSYKISNGEIIFTISDTGIGIDKQYYDIIFERFRQAETGNTKIYGGTGLGLAICKSMVEILDGKIWFESKPGEGSTFYFSIPNEAIGKTPEKVKESKKNEIPDFSSYKIILAEDDEANYFFMHSILAKTKANIIHAVNGQQVVELLKSNPDSDIILMDIKMPILDGLEATKEIRGSGSEIPIIAVTAYALKEEKRLSIEAGCNDYITKPIQVDDFFRRIKKQLNKRN